MSERLPCDDTEAKQPLADVPTAKEVSTLRFMATLRHGRCRLDSIVGATEEEMERLAGRGLVRLVSRINALVGTPDGKRFRKVPVYEITREGRHMAAESYR